MIRPRKALLPVLACAAAIGLAACSPESGQPATSRDPGSGAASTPSATPTSSSAEPPAAAPAPEPEPIPLSPQAQADVDGRLILAAKANDAAQAATLIAAGGSVNAKDAIQDSAFLYAGAEGFNEVLQLTLAAGADVASTNRYGGTALIPASEHGHTETVAILLAAGVPVNHVNNLGWTALQEAILLNTGGPRQQEVVRLLLAAGADPMIRDPEGRTALDNAQRLGFTEIADLIMAGSAPGS